MDSDIDTDTDRDTDTDTYTSELSSSSDDLDSDDDNWLLNQNRLLRVLHKEAKKQMARERNLEDRIQNGRQKFANTFTSRQSREDPTDPLQLLPEEVWLLLLKMPGLTLKDQLSCYHSCQLFQDLLRDTISKQMFGHILSFVLPKLDAKDVLNCRLVCSAWKKSVDALLEQQPRDLYLKDKEGEDCRGNLYLDGVDLDGIMKGLYRFHLPYSSDFELSPHGGHVSHNNIRDQLRQHHNNPFIGRKIQLFLKDPFDEAISDATQLMRDFGDFIYHLLITCTTRRVNIARFYIFCIRGIVQCCNLQSVSITCQLSDSENNVEDYGEDDDIDVDNDEIREQARLLRIVRRMPPSGIHFNGGVDKNDGTLLKTIIFDILSSRLTQATTNCWNELFPKMVWTNLTSLTISCKVDEEILGKLARMNFPNLKRLEINCATGTNPYSWFRKLVLVLDFLKSLSFLVLNVDESPIEKFFGYPSWGTEKLLLLEVPESLTTLVIHGTYALCNLDILLLFPSIKELAIRSETNMEFIYPQQYEYEIFFDFRKSLSSLKDNWDSKKRIETSIVWEVLALLRTLFITIPWGQITISKR